VFEKRLPDSIEKQPFKKILEVAYVKRVIEEADGIQPHLVAPEAGYRRLLEEALGYLKDPTEKSVEEVGGGAGGGRAGRCSKPGVHRWRRCSGPDADGGGAVASLMLGCDGTAASLMLGCDAAGGLFTSHHAAAAGQEQTRSPRLLAWPPVAQVFVLLRRMVDNVANSDDVRALRRYPTLRREIVTAAYRALEKFKVQAGSALAAAMSCVTSSCSDCSLKKGSRQGLLAGVLANPPLLLALRRMTRARW
jgi:hypothetical protein